MTGSSITLVTKLGQLAKQKPAQEIVRKVLYASLLGYVIASALSPIIYMERFVRAAIFAVLSVGIGAPLLFTEPRLLAIFDTGWRWDRSSLTLLLEALRNRSVLTALALVMSTFILSSFIETFYWAYRASGLAWVSFLSVIVFVMFPCTAVLMQRAGKRLQAQARSVTVLPKSILPRFGLKVREKLSTFLVNRYAYSSFYLGCVWFCAILAFAPDGLGESISNWLTASMSDAQIYTGRLELFTLLVSSLTFAALFISVRGLVVRLASGYQHLLKRTIMCGDGLLEALMETVSNKSSKIPVFSKHPHVRNILSISVYLAGWYAFIIFMVAFCPGGINASIGNWISQSMADAGINPLIYWNHFGFRLFIASVIAAFGAAPLAAMSCAFVPNRRPNYLRYSHDGLLLPDRFAQVLGQCPVKDWSELQAIAITDFKNPEKQTLNLSFKHGEKLKVRTSSIDKEQLHSFLSVADESSRRCTIEQSTLNFMSSMRNKLEADTGRDISKFSSTIFTPKSFGDLLKNGEFRVIKKLSGKPLSAVYLARNRENERVIVKEYVLPTAVQKCEQWDESFNREFDILSVLKNDNIARVLDRFEEKGSRFLVIEHVDGADLRAIVNQRGPRNAKSVLRLASKISTLMQFLHSQNPPILHRDLTPDNLMEDQEGNLKLIDFGAAHQLMEGVTGTLIGKQCYIAPEQLRGHPTVASDIYSFGCTLFFLLTGNDPKALKQSNLDWDVTQRDKAVLKELVAKCTAFDENDRFSSFDEVLQTISSLAIVESSSLVHSSRMPLVPSHE